MKRIPKSRINLRNLRIFGILAILLVSLGGVGHGVQAETGFQFDNLDVIYTFGEQVSFLAQYKPVNLAKKVFLFFQPAGEDTRLIEMPLNPQGNCRLFLRSHHPLFASIQPHGILVSSRNGRRRKSGESETSL